MKTRDSEKSQYKNLIILVRADPIICGHSTEARNLAEAAMKLGFEEVHIVSYPIDILEKSGLPLKPLYSLSPYSEGIYVDRPAPVGDYKVLDGRIGLGISGQIIDLLHKLQGPSLVMDLYVVPHGQMVMSAIDSFRGMNKQVDVSTIAEVVGSDITNVVSNAVAAGQFGAAQLVLSNLLHHDLAVAVSQFTKDVIIDAAEKVDAELKTSFAKRLEDRIMISYPAIDTSAYLSIEKEENAHVVEDVLANRGLVKDGYIMFLSRVARAKGVDDLIEAYRQSSAYGRKKLLICGNGPALEAMKQLALNDPHIDFATDVSDSEKGILMYGCAAYCLPSRPRAEFVETFGIAVAEKMLSGGRGPVITTRVGGIPEATGGFCLEHEPDDIDGLTACLEKAVNMLDAEREKLAAEARAYAMQFDRHNVLQNLVRLSLEQGKGD